MYHELVQIVTGYPLKLSQSLSISYSVQKCAAISKLSQPATIQMML